MIGNDNLVGYFDTALSGETREEAARPVEADYPAEPQASFVRGVAVGLAVMVPVWACIIVLIVR